MPWEPAKFFLNVEEYLDQRILLEIVLRRILSTSRSSFLISRIAALSFDLPEAFGVIFGFVLQVGKLVEQLPFFQTKRVSLSENVQSLKQQIIFVGRARLRLHGLGCFCFLFRILSPNARRTVSSSFSGSTGFVRKSNAPSFMDSTAESTVRDR